MEYIISPLIIVGAVVILSLPGYQFRRRVFVNGSEIIIKNNPLGIETIILDGKKVVSKFAFGGIYDFPVGNSKVEVDYYLRLCGLAVGITVRKDGEIIYSDK